jgi:uncharacterized protein (DUF3084 family)
MITYVCEHHGDDVVVFHAQRATEASCPLCRALTDCREADQKIEDLTTERDGLSEQNQNLTAERDWLQDEIREKRDL